MTNQKEDILNYINENGSITQMEAFYECGCMRLPARICELRQDGHPIKTKMEKVKTKKGYTYIARYSL